MTETAEYVVEQEESVPVGGAPLPFEDEPPPAVVKEEEKPEEQPPTLPVATREGAPDWVILPEGMKFPRGRQIVFMRFWGKETTTPWKGDRQCIVWPNNVPDQKLALGRSMQDPNRLQGELVKQMIRAVDGHMVNWDGLQGPGNIDTWWEELAETQRNMLSRVFMQLHVPTPAQVRDFFANCVAVRTAG